MFVIVLPLRSEFHLHFGDILIKSTSIYLILWRNLPKISIIFLSKSLMITVRKTMFFLYQEVLLDIIIYYFLQALSSLRTGTMWPCSSRHYTTKWCYVAQFVDMSIYLLNLYIIFIFINCYFYYFL